MLLKRSYCYHKVKEDAINQGNKTMKIHVQPAYSRAYLQSGFISGN